MDASGPLNFGYNDVAPRTMAQRLALILVMLLPCLLMVVQRLAHLSDRPNFTSADAFALLALALVVVTAWHFDRTLQTVNSVTSRQSLVVESGVLRIDDAVDGVKSYPLAEVKFIRIVPMFWTKHGAYVFACGAETFRVFDHISDRHVLFKILNAPTSNL